MAASFYGTADIDVGAVAPKLMYLDSIVVTGTTPVVSVRKGGSSGTIMFTIGVGEYAPQKPYYIGPNVYIDLVSGTGTISAQVS